MLSYQTEVNENPGELLRSARDLAKVNRAQGFSALHDLFRAGIVPNPAPDGRYRGELVVLDIAPVLTPVFQRLASAWMPWLGKTFNASQRRGDNIFRNDSYLLARVFNPLYRGFRTDRPGTYGAFAFHTYTAPGLFDQDRIVLKIDYDLKENPPLTVWRVLDELVQLDEDLYLGKAHVRWWLGGWQTVAFFSLTYQEPS